MAPIIRVSDEVYEALSQAGKMGDSMDSVIRRLLNLPTSIDRDEPIVAPGGKSAKAHTLPQQARQIVEILVENGPIPRSELLEIMQVQIVTRQPIDRIYAFYRRKLLDNNFIKETGTMPNVDIPGVVSRAVSQGLMVLPTYAECRVGKKKWQMSINADGLLEFEGQTYRRPSYAVAKAQKTDIAGGWPYIFVRSKDGSMISLYDLREKMSK